MEEKLPLGDIYEIFLLMLSAQPNMEFKFTRRIAEEADFSKFVLIHTYDRIKEQYQYKLEELETNEDDPPVATDNR